MDEIVLPEGTQMEFREVVNGFAREGGRRFTGAGTILPHGLVRITNKGQVVYLSLANLKSLALPKGAEVVNTLAPETPHAYVPEMAHVPEVPSPPPGRRAPATKVNKRKASLPPST